MAKQVVSGMATGTTSWDKRRRLHAVDVDLLGHLDAGELMDRDGLGDVDRGSLQSRRGSGASRRVEPVHLDG